MEVTDKRILMGRNHPVDRELRINQTNNCSIWKEFGGKIELIQSNTSTVQGDINDELKIIQINTNIIRKKGSSIPEPVQQVQVNTLPEASIPQSVFWALDVVSGKIREEIAKGFFKTELLELISRARRYLELGKVAKAVAVLTVTGDELKFVYDSASYEKPPCNQVRRLLLEAQKALAEIL